MMLAGVALPLALAAMIGIGLAFGGVNALFITRISTEARAMQAFGQRGFSWRYISSAVSARLSALW
jgi:hypothetical protein